METTVRAAVPVVQSSEAPVAGVVLVLSGSHPRCTAIPLEDGAVVLGRGGPAGEDSFDVAAARACRLRRSYLVDRGSRQHERGDEELDGGSGG